MSITLLIPHVDNHVYRIQGTIRRTVAKALMPKVSSRGGGDDRVARWRVAVMGVSWP